MIASPIRSKVSSVRAFARRHGLSILQLAAVVEIWRDPRRSECMAADIGGCPGSTYGYAMGINDAGKLVGYTRIKGPPPNQPSAAPNPQHGPCSKPSLWASASGDIGVDASRLARHSTPPGRQQYRASIYIHIQYAIIVRYGAYF
jgi:hypothetical protein